MQKHQEILWQLSYPWTSKPPRPKQGRHTCPRKNPEGWCVDQDEAALAEADPDDEERMNFLSSFVAGMLWRK